MMDDTPLKTMWDDMMGGHRDPHMIIDRLIRSEEAEIPVYEELARTAPNEPLRRRIEMMAQEEREEIERLRLLHNMYPATQSPTPYTEPEITLSQFRNWPEMAFALRNMELRQCAMLCHLAAITSDPAVAAVVMELASDEAFTTLCSGTISYWLLAGHGADRRGRGLPGAQAGDGNTI